MAGPTKAAMFLRQLEAPRKVTVTVKSLQTLYTEKTGDVFWRHLFGRVTFLQG